MNRAMRGMIIPAGDAMGGHCARQRVGTVAVARERVTEARVPLICEHDPDSWLSETRFAPERCSWPNI
jgi:hypothetical protein